MNFLDSVKYLLALGNEVSAMKLGLRNIRKLLTALDNPQNNYLKVQVAGTNGKGSVCAFLGAICVSAGVKTGIYTSPHLISITERIRINGHDIPEKDFARYSTTVRETAEKLVADGELESIPTFFEQLTAIALIAFAEANVELAILETGLGGRLDATTAANAEIAAITRIDIDHQEYLGETLAEIAAEKAAIISTGSIVVVANQKADAMTVISERCAAVGVCPILASGIRAIQKGGNTRGSECVIDSAVSEYGGKTLFPPVGFPASLSVNFVTASCRYENVTLGLNGRHQLENAKVAILIAETLQDNFPINATNIIDGLQNARHPGRLEFSDRYLFDGAHNAAGAKSLRDFLDESVTGRITLVFGAMKGKDIGQIALMLFPKADKVILTRPENSRAMSADEIMPFVPDGIDAKQISLTDTVEQALLKANELTFENDIILVTGSLYLIGEAKKILNN